MYINKIDEFIDKIIDDFYNKVILKKGIDTFFSEINFVKYQLKINKLFMNYIDQIDKNEINKILNDEDNTTKIIEIIKKYIAYYVFMSFAFFYKGKIETYINNVIEFSKNQPGFNFRIINFFNSESNSIIIKFYTLIKNILILVDADPVKLQQLAKKTEFKDTIKFLNEFGQEFVNSNFKLQNLNGNLKEQAHNIIKTIIINELYYKNDKKDVYQFLEKSEKEIGEFIYIDIVIPRTEFIDFNTIELSLSSRDIDNGLASEIYDLLINLEEIDRIKEKNHDEKILDLINNNLIIPISEDFLLYHKDSEKYEKSLGISNVSVQTKKKDETKIKYIINKIDSTTEYFSKSVNDKKDLKKNIEKLFYPPLNDRRAILVNNFEDIKIINKLQNQGRRAIENNEYFNDLLNYRQYPYINFKDFQKYGFNLITNNTIDVIRSINFEKINIMNKNKNIQFRISSEGLSINIIGFILPPKYSDVKCLKLKEFIDVRKIGHKENDKMEKDENGYNTSLKVIKKIILNNKKNKRLPFIYWLFDLEKDKVKFEKYDVGSKMSNSEHIKMMMSKFYDDLLDILNQQVIKIFNNKKITLQQFTKLINKINRKLIEFPKNSELYNNLEKLFYYQKVIKTENIYDKKDDLFPGILGEIIKLPIAPKKKKEIPFIILEKFKISKNAIELESMEAEKFGAICQHNVTWDNIALLRNKNPNRFSELLFEFFQQYVIKNHEGDFICKSCGALINLKNYVLDGSYDTDGRFVSFNMPLEIPIEDIPEYEKYKSTIRNLEKIIERIASISNINSLTGTSYTIKARIKKVVKDSIDLILIHNSNLKNIYKERSEKISQYGLNRDLSNLFIFDLDNSIFIYSSKDKDFYKPIKRNNIIIYILFLIILELSDSQLLYMTGDKICNYYLFSKYGINWFNDILIRKNNQGLVTPILNYKVLCYLIFYMSCLLTKYNLWYYETDEPEKKKKFDPLIQKIIINTFIDFVNSIIEIYSRKKKHYLYDIVATKFFLKLNTTFKNEELLNKIKSIEERKLITTDKKTKIVTTSIKSIILQNEYNEGNYLGISDWISCKIPKYFIKMDLLKLEKYFEITNATNCIQGTFHHWQVKGNDLVCSICGVNANEIDNSSVLSEKILNNDKILILQKLAKKYCKSGEFHNYIYNTQTKCNICMKCKNLDVDSINKEDLEELAKNVEEMKKLKEKQFPFKGNKNHLAEKTKNFEFINKVKSEYGKSKQHKEDYYHFIDQFISKIESVLGKDVNLNNENIFLRHDAYIINHDHNGYPLEKPFTITDIGNKINFRKDHPFFKKDVIYYTNYKLQIDVFYDASTKLLLGYKEKNKDFQKSKRQNIYLKVNNSIMSRLKMLGYSSKYIDITEKMVKYKQIFKDPNTILIHIISDIGRNRVQNLKKVIMDLQRYIYRLAYNYDVKPIDEENNPDKFFDKYKNKLNKIILRKDKNDKFLYKWKAIKYGLFFEDLTNKIINLDPNSKFFSIEDINLYDYNGNVILYYIVHEMGKLLDINPDKFIKATLSYLLLDIIVREHDEFDEEKDLTNTEIKRFKYILDIQDLREVEDVGDVTEGFYSELIDDDPEVQQELYDRNEEATEEFESLDMETPDLDNVLAYDGQDYQDGVNYNYYDSYIGIHEGDGNELI